VGAGASTAIAALLVAACVLAWPGRGQSGARLASLTRGRRAAPGRSEKPMSRWRRRPGRFAAAGAQPRAGSAADRAGPLEVSPTVVLELVAAALRAGLPGPQAVDAAATACGTQVRQRLAVSLDAWRLGIPAERAWATVDPAFEPLARSLVLAERTGASAAVVLAAAASDARSARQRRAVVAARRLGVLLVLPLGLTTLPAFVVLGVVPVVLGLAGQLLQTP
jgi:hypothetical protein